MRKSTEYRWPFLIVSDAITGPTGLGRVTRELAVRIHDQLSDVFEVGVCGYGGTYSKKFPFSQYAVMRLENWAIPQLPQVWNDFAGDRKGIIFMVWNPSWLNWMSNPDSIPDGDLKTFMKSGRFQKWGYFPVDSEGPHGMLDKTEVEVMWGFDRFATYTEWAAGVIEKTSAYYGNPISVAHLPHGTDNVFHERNKDEARRQFIRRVKGLDIPLQPDIFLVGVCATNTPRKDWGLAFEVCQELLNRNVNVGIWAHTDVFQNKFWNLTSLAERFGMTERVIFTNGHISDEDMAWAYSACDVTLGIGSGEGWGLPLSESLACGIPCVTGDYSGVKEFVPRELRYSPDGWRYEGFYSAKRPIYVASRVAEHVMSVNKSSHRHFLEPIFYWDNCFEDWKAWLLEGVTNWT